MSTTQELTVSSSKKRNFGHFLALLADKSEQVVFVFDLSTLELVYLNGAFEQVFGRDKEIFLATPAQLLETLHPEDKPYLERMYRELKEGAEKKNFEFRILLPDNSPHWLCLSAYQIQEDQERWLVGSAQNITPQKIFNDKMRELHARKNSVLEILSHDLASPLRTIQGLSALIERKTKSYQDESLAEIVALIQNSCARGVQLIREFVGHEFLESSKATLLKQRVDLVEKIREVMDQYQKSEKQIAKTFQLVAGQEKIWVALDEFKFMQVINNLLSNAIKFTPDGGVITIELNEQDSHVLLTIQDNGIGIPAHLQAGLFDKFTKARRPGIKGEPSVGLGMSIIKTIVEWHEGRIWFESQEHKGTTFWIELPKE